MAGWTDGFFSSEWTSVQRSIWTPQISRDEAYRIAELLKLNSACRILDMPCGDGRHAVQLAQQGYVVTGVDGSLRMLAAGVLAARDMGVNPTFRYADMRTVFLPEMYDAAYCYWGSFGYFSDADNDRVLSNFRRCVKTNGRILINTHCLETIARTYFSSGFHTSHTREYHVGKRMIREIRTFDTEKNLLHCETYIELPSGQLQKLLSSIRIYSIKELSGKLEENAFTVEKLFDGRKDSDFSSDSRYLSVVCLKR